MDAVENVKETLRPKFLTLIEYLNDQDEVLAASFFIELLVQLQSAREEEELLSVFINLSSTAFMGFQFDTVSWALADSILQEAEQVAHAFTAPASRAH